MFSSKKSSTSIPSSHSHSIASKASGSHPAQLPNAAVLPTGECRFILLHPSISDQRCCCQGFRRNKSLPGAICECGHQACYHVPGSTPATTTEPMATTTTTTTHVSHAPLLDRIRKLEERYQQDRKILEDQLKAERRARREDSRNLREAMHSFYKFMEQEVPGKFVEMEDKIDAVMDRELRLKERVFAIDDSNMALENRIADLENDGDDGLSKYSDDMGDSRERKRRKSVEKTVEPREIVPDTKKAASDINHTNHEETHLNAASSTSSMDSPRLRSPFSLLPPTSSRSSTPPSEEPSPCDRNPASDFASYDCLDAPAAISGAQTSVRVLTSPQYDFLPAPGDELDLAKPPSGPDSYCRDNLLHSTRDLQSTPTPHTNRDQYQETQESSASFIRTMSSSSLPGSGNFDAKKRKRDMTLQSRGVGLGPQLTLPLPPPLSLSWWGLTVLSTHPLIYLTKITQRFHYSFQNLSPLIYPTHPSTYSLLLQRFFLSLLSRAIAQNESYYIFIAFFGLKLSCNATQH